MRIAVVTDSAAGFPAGWRLPGGPAEGIGVVPMPVLVGDEILTGEYDDVTEPLMMALAAGADVRTSRPSPGQFDRLYGRLADDGYDGIVSVHLSGLLSGTADAARLAASRARVPVEVIDTRTAAMAQGRAALAALAAARGGADLQASAAAAAMAARGSALFFYVPSLEQLRRGGRISGAAGWLGTLLSVRVILHVRGGRLVPLERMRTAARGLQRLQELAEADVARRGRGVRLTVHHFGSEEEAAALVGRLELSIGSGLVSLAPCPAVLAAHAGLGVVAITVSAEQPGLA
ncbi:fatty acid-binding protein DegV [Arthrobacter pityocampae]|uniref:Fatty acid-binding protein DegV n=1 Tax=Arthrobacter pityocampae TaxID=547334 RepID=A0A2S5IZI2_9MICC|nr:DegV family protein [Arthrobacter pityocampae]PPB49900.1 fatty acid-binding protein DegV [Arthrobacter pityocampae]